MRITPESTKIFPEWPDYTVRRVTTDLKGEDGAFREVVAVRTRLGFVPITAAKFVDEGGFRAAMEQVSSEVQKRKE